jgi:hypothetical protein
MFHDLHELAVAEGDPVVALLALRILMAPPSEQEAAAEAVLEAFRDFMQATVQLARVIVSLQLGRSI